MKDWIIPVRKIEFTRISKHHDFKDEVVLEIGCGNGFQASLLKPRCKRLISTDISLNRLSEEKKKELTIVICDAQQLPFKENAFDLIFSSNVIEHIPNKDKALQEMKRVSRGNMIHSIPLAAWKNLQMITYYIDLSSRAANKLLRVLKKERKVNGSSEKKLKSSGKNLLIPRIHGTARTNLEELKEFNRKNWQNLFQRNDLKIEKIIRMPFYPAYPQLLKICLKLGEWFRLSSSDAFILSHHKSE